MKGMLKRFVHHLVWRKISARDSAQPINYGQIDKDNWRHNLSSRRVPNEKFVTLHCKNIQILNTGISVYYYSIFPWFCSGFCQKCFIFSIKHLFHCYSVRSTNLSTWMLYPLFQTLNRTFWHFWWSAYFLYTKHRMMSLSNIIF